MTKLIIYNLETDLKSSVLAAAHDWISEFAKQVDEITVFSTHVGKTELPKNVRVVEIGGGDIRKRLLATLRLYLGFAQTLRNRRELFVFHHMSPRTLLLLGPFYRVLKVPQGLWYSHSVKSISLKLSHKLANKIFSSTARTLPYENKNCFAIGHGIDATRFRAEFKSSSMNRTRMVALGRVAPIKNVQDAINGLAKVEESARVLHCIGPCDESSSYVTELKTIAMNQRVELHLEGPQSYSMIPKTLCGFSMIFTGTPISVDKAVIEGAICGCFVITTGMEAQELTGMSEIWLELGLEGQSLSLETQVQILLKLAPEQESHLRERLSRISTSKNSLENTVQKILCELER